MKLKKYLISRTKLRNFNSIEGFLSFNEGYALFQLSKQLKPGSVVAEIGSWKGKSTYCIGKGLAKHSRIFAIDPFNAIGDTDSQEVYEKKKGGKPLIDQFWTNMGDAGITNKIIPCIGLAEEYKDFIPPAHFIFIDGDHSIEGCEKDFLMYVDKLENEGLMAFHDYYPDRDDLGPTYVIKKYLSNSPHWKKIDVIDSLAVFQKTTNK